VTAETAGLVAVRDSKAVPGGSGLLGTLMEHPVIKKIEAIDSGTVRRMKKVDDTGTFMSSEE
jgi:hypothetical protein